MSVWTFLSAIVVALVVVWRTERRMMIERRKLVEEWNRIQSLHGERMPRLEVRGGRIREASALGAGGSSTSTGVRA